MEEEEVNKGKEGDEKEENGEKESEERLVCFFF